MASLNILVFVKKRKLSSEGKCPIFLRLSFNNQRAEIALKRSISPKLWDNRKQCASGRNPESESINSQIRAYKNSVYKHYSRLIEKEELISAKKLKDLFYGLDRGNKSIIEVFEFHNTKMEKQVGRDYAKGTFERYKTCLKLLKEHIKATYNSNDFSLESLKLEFITGFDYFLRTVRKCNNNTTIKYIKNLRKIINEARSYEWMTHDPFLNYKAKLESVNREALTQDEIDTITNKEFGIERLDFIKDIFLFSCYTGLAYSDAKKLSKNDLFHGIDGKLWIKINRTKTNVTSRIPVLPVAQTILNRYQDNPCCLSENRLLPIPSNQRYNSYLKELADCCGIKKNLTTHLARHTFATTITLNNKIPLETVSKMLGHKSLAATQLYGKISEVKISDDMSDLMEKYVTKNPIKAVNE